MLSSFTHHISQNTKITWTERGTPHYTRVSFSLFLVGFVTFSLLYCVQPILPELAQSFTITPTESSFALSLTTGFLALSIFCSGALATNLGRKSLMLTSMLGGSLLNILVALIPSWPMFLGLRALEGLVLGGVPAVAMAYLAEEIHPKDLGFAMGLYVGGTAFGGMFGRIAVGSLAEVSGWHRAIGLLGTVDCVAAILFGLILPSSRNFTRKEHFDAFYHARAWKKHLTSSNLFLLFIIGSLAMGVFVTIFNYIDFRLEAPPFRLSPTIISCIFLSYVCGIFASPIAGSLADKKGKGLIILAGLLLTATGLALTTTYSLIMLILGIFIFTTGFFTVHSVASSWVGHLAQSDKGHASSLYLLFYYLGSSIFGSIGGVFWSVDNWSGITIYCSTLLIFAILAGLTLIKHTHTHTFLHP